MKSNLVFGLILFSAVQTLAVASPVIGQVLSSEEAETAKLNISIQKSNADAAARYENARKEYMSQAAQYDQLRQQYLSDMKDYDERNAKYQEEKRKNDLLQEQFRNKFGTN